MTTKRIKVQLPNLVTRDDAEAAMNELALTINNQRKIVAKRDGQVLAINKDYESPLAELDQAIKAKTDSLRAWAESSPDQFPKGRKSIDLIAGTLGFRTGTPKLALLSRAWTWDKVLAAISRMKDLADLFIRTKQEVDKEAIIGIYKDIQSTPVAQEELRLMGVKITQEESFFIEPNLTSLETRQTQEAA